MIKLLTYERMMNDTTAYEEVSFICNDDEYSIIEFVLYSDGNKDVKAKGDVSLEDLKEAIKLIENEEIKITLGE